MGKTGTGKSTLGREITMDNDRLIVVDSKRSPAVARFPDLEPWHGPLKEGANPRLKHAIRTVLRSGPNELESQVRLQRRMEGKEPFRAHIKPPPGYDYEELWEWIFETLRHVTVYIDEIYLTLPESGRGGKWFKALYTQGRERFIGMIGCVQRPSGIPLIALSECEYFYLFRLNIPEDVMRMKKVMGDIATTPLRGHMVTVYHDENEYSETFNKVEVTG